MRDPYQVLGVPSTATDEEVKKAYRDLARKYHPDNYHDNPLADLAQERMKEINEAYETVQSQRKAARSGGGYTGGYQTGYQSPYQNGYQSSGRYQRVRMAITQGDLNLAEELGIPVQESVRTGGSTNGAPIHLSNMGVPTIVIGIPVRYIHTHYGIAAHEDVVNAGKLAAAILERADADLIGSF